MCVYIYIYIKKWFTLSFISFSFIYFLKHVFHFIAFCFLRYGLLFLSAMVSPEIHQINDTRLHHDPHQRSSGRGRTCSFLLLTYLFCMFIFCFLFLYFLFSMFITAARVTVCRLLTTPRGNSVIKFGRLLTTPRDHSVITCIKCRARFRPATRYPPPSSRAGWVGGPGSTPGRPRGC